jgi:hypothetical protein
MMSRRDAFNEGAQYHEQGPSPLDYTESSAIHPQRAALVNPNIGEPEKGDLYFKELRSKTMIGPSGRRLKKPREKITPGAAPGTVAFADYSEDVSPGWTMKTETGEEQRPPTHRIYVHYMKTRGDVQGQGHASRLLDEMVKSHPETNYVDFGKIMNETMDRVYEKFAQRHPQLRTNRKKFY